MCIQYPCALQSVITSFKPAKIVSFNMCWRSLGEKAVIYPIKYLKQLLMTLTPVNYWFIYVSSSNEIEFGYFYSTPTKVTERNA